MGVRARLAALAPRTPSSLVTAVAVAVVAASAVSACTSAPGEPAADASSTTTSAARPVAFPLTVSADGRHLVDRAGRPFLYAADTSWTMLSQLDVADAKRLLDLRRAQGFNAVQTVLTPFSVTAAGPRGTPFEDGDLTRPRPEYWAGVDEVMKYAEALGTLLYVAPLWMADNGGWGCDHGACHPAPTDVQMQTYMSWVGTRYRDRPNLLWVIGGDDEIDRNREVKLLGARALRAVDPGKLMTYHPRWAEYGFSAEDWHDLNAFQKNDITPPYNYEQIREALAARPTKPVLDAEPPYEPTTAMQDGEVTTPKINRRFGWWAATSGAMGVVYGGPEGAWKIGREAPPDWSAVEREPARHTGTIRRILDPLPWYRLVPDWDATTVTDGRGRYGGDDYATAARADDGSLVVAFAPSARTFTVDLGRLSGPATARWFDPVSGRAAEASPRAGAAGSVTFATPGRNAGGDDDWVLVISTDRGGGPG